jgi:hypothetical protein
MRRELIWSFLGMLGCLGVAFWASLPSKSAQQGSQKVYSVSLSDIGEISFTGPELSYSVIKVNAPATQDQKKSQWWMTLTKGQSSERFLLSSKFDEMLAQWESLNALRVVGKESELKIADYGLDSPKSTFTIKDSGQKVLLDLAIGSESFGSRNLFTMEKSSRMVWLLSDSLLGDLMKPELKFYERTINSLVFDDLTGAVVSSGDKTVTFVREKRDEKGIFVWTKTDVQGEVSASMKSWMDRVDRVRVVAGCWGRCLRGADDVGR